MSGPIQTLPAGLLSALQLKNKGQNPANLVDQVAPTLDMFPWYTNDQLRRLDEQSTLVAPFGAGFKSVPALATGNDWWYVRSMSTYMAAASGATVAGDTIEFQNGWIVGSLNSQVEGERARFTKSAASELYQKALAKDFWVPPRSTLGIWVSEVVNAAARDMTFVYRVDFWPISL